MSAEGAKAPSLYSRLSGGAKGRDSSYKKASFAGLRDKGVALVHGSTILPTGARRRASRWVKVRPETRSASVLQHMKGIWGIPEPAAIVSVIGTGARLREQQEISVRRVLSLVMQKTQGWLVTDGVMPLLGAAVQPHPCIGIVRLGDVPTDEVGGSPRMPLPVESTAAGPAEEKAGGRRPSILQGLVAKHAQALGLGEALKKRFKAKGSVR